MDRDDLILQFLDGLNASTTVEQLLQQTVEFLHRAFRLENCVLWANGTTMSPFPVSQPFLNISKALNNHVVATNAFVLVHNPSNDVLTSHIKEAKDFKSQIAAFPVRLQGKPVASVSLSSSNSLSSHGELISILLDKLGIALNRAQRFQDAQHSAMTDALTQLYNKAYFLEALKNEVARSRSSQRPISLIIFDLDNFKEYNDLHGHMEGDKLLKNLGEVLRSVTQGSGVSARYGGEEFVVILSETAHEPAFTFAEKLRLEILEKCGVSISIGIASCLNSSVSAETLFKEADTALYKAKRNGKNQTRAFLIIDKALGVIDVQEAAGLGKR